MRHSRKAPPRLIPRRRSQPEDNDRAALIARINELSHLARTAWFTLLGYLVFVGITLLGVKDADFFIPSRETQLPLVGVSIPTASFFWTAPVLGAALYTYMHLFLIKLWDAHATARTKDADPTHHWLVNDFVLIRQGDPTARARPMAWLVVEITVALVWLAAPLVLTFAWYRSLPAHDLWLTLLIAMCLGLSLHAGMASWRRARMAYSDKPGVLRSLLRWLPFPVTLLLLVTSFDLTRYGFYLGLYPADLRGAKFVTLPPDWRPYDTAIRIYRETWCRREGLEMRLCGHPVPAGTFAPSWLVAARLVWCNSESRSTAAQCANRFAAVEARFQSDWKDERARMLAALHKASLRGKDLRRADLTDAMLIGVDLTDSQLGGAMLDGAGIEGVKFWGSIARDAVFSRVDMRFADMEWLFLPRGLVPNVHLSRLDGMHIGALGGIHITESSLRGAGFDSTSPWGSYIEGSDLTAADFSDRWIGAIVLGNSTLTGANVTNAEFSNVVLDGSDLRAVIGLTQDQLSRAVGNEQTLLPVKASQSDPPFYVMSCLIPPQDPSSSLLDFAVVDAKKSLFPRPTPRTSVYCNTDETPERTGTPMFIGEMLAEDHPADIAKRAREFSPPASY